jgi:hypothetical protein
MVRETSRCTTVGETSLHWRLEVGNSWRNPPLREADNSWRNFPMRKVG